MVVKINTRVKGKRHERRISGLTGYLAYFGGILLLDKNKTKQN
jgi:hypothetical protein